MKMILKKSGDEYLALLNYRDTPLHNGYSPAKLSMGRKLRTRVPCHPDELKPKTPDYDHLRKKEREYRTKMKLNYDRRHRVVDGEQLSPGDRVWIPDLKAEGTVMEEHAAPRSVAIQSPNGQVRRNRRMTRRVLGGSLPVVSHSASHEILEPLATRVAMPDITSASRASQEELRNPLVPDSQDEEEEPAKPSGSPQSHRQLTRLRPREALKRPKKYIDEY